MDHFTANFFSWSKKIDFSNTGTRPSSVYHYESWSSLLFWIWIPYEILDLQIFSLIWWFLFGVCCLCLWFIFSKQSRPILGSFSLVFQHHSLSRWSFLGATFRDYVVLALYLVSWFMCLFLCQCHVGFSITITVFSIILYNF